MTKHCEAPAETEGKLKSMCNSIFVLEIVLEGNEHSGLRWETGSRRAGIVLVPWLVDTASGLAPKNRATMTLPCCYDRASLNDGAGVPMARQMSPLQGAVLEDLKVASTVVM